MGKTFSERMGYIPPKAVQLESVDGALRNLLWSETHDWLMELKQYAYEMNHSAGIFRLVWVDFFKQSHDIFDAQVREKAHYHEISTEDRWAFLIHASRSFFFGDKTPWHRLFDFIEFVLRFRAREDAQRDAATADLNARLEGEKSAYRIVSGQFVPITNKTEIAAVEAASAPASTALAPVAVHVQKALDHLADRTAPDYRNSIKESISAVESLCKFIANMPTQTLGPALEKTAKELDLNDHVRDGMKAFFKYTSDTHGIRHGLKDHAHPGQEDALFMLVTCSAFVNFVTEKARKQGKLPA